MKNQPTTNKGEKVKFKVNAKGEIRMITIDGKPLNRWEDGVFTAYGIVLNGISLAQLPPKLRLRTCIRRDRSPQLEVKEIEIVNETTALVQIGYGICRTCWYRPDSVEEHINNVAKFLRRMRTKQKEILDVWFEGDYVEPGVCCQVKVTGQNIEDIIAQAKAVFTPVYEHFFRQVERDDAHRPVGMKLTQVKSNKKRTKHN